jgi:hypothetical protein
MFVSVGGGASMIRGACFGAKCWRLFDVASALAVTDVAIKSRQNYYLF